MGLRNRLIPFRHMTAGDWVEGVWTGQTEGTPFNVRCSVQPLTLAQLSALPEGRRELRSFALFTSTQLRDTKTQNPDRGTIDGEEYEVFSCNPWQNGIINHYEVIVQLVQETAAAV